MRRALPAAALVALLAVAGCGHDSGKGADQTAEQQMAAKNMLMTSPMPGRSGMPMVGTGAGAPVLPCTGLDSPLSASKGGTGSSLPSLVLSCLGGGRPVTLSALRGPMLLNVWASWCGPCHDELPYLLEAHRAAGSRVRFLGVDLTDSDAPAREWLSYNGVGWPSLADPKGSVRGPLNVPGPPVTLFVNSDGRVVGVHYGAFTSARQVEDAIGEHLGVA